MDHANAIPKQADSNKEGVRERTTLDHIIERLASMELPGKEHLDQYMHYKWRMNHKPKTMKSSFTSIVLFLSFYGASGKSDITRLERSDLEAFIEHEQDRGMYISTVRVRMASVIAFVHFLMEQNILSPLLLKKTIRLKLPETLPRAMNPSDVKRLIESIDDVRDRALILLLLRTGIRIGEALSLTMNDIDLAEKRIHVLEGEKNSMGRVVYLSGDALFALKRWLAIQNKENTFIFSGRGNSPICYSTARSRFAAYLRKAGLEHKGYTVHCLRHTFASELLNAGMRLEVLQQLLGHRDIEVTRHYARLTDRTREEEYFRAMAIIEKGGIHGDY
jgi:site-specific recombinase XerD